MEYCDAGSCLDLLKISVFKELDVACIMSQTLKGLEYIHSLGKIHRDIKAANILLTHTGHVKVLLESFRYDDDNEGTLIIII